MQGTSLRRGWLLLLVSYGNTNAPKIAFTFHLREMDEKLSKCGNLTRGRSDFSGLPSATISCANRSSLKAEK